MNCARNAVSSIWANRHRHFRRKAEQACRAPDYIDSDNYEKFKTFDGMLRSFMIFDKPLGECLNKIEY